jgi:hypothetical protein
VNHVLHTEEFSIGLDDEGVYLELGLAQQAELAAILTRALSTMDPQKTPQWATWLSDKLSNMPEEATKGWYAVRNK